MGENYNVLLICLNSALCGPSDLREMTLSFPDLKCFELKLHCKKCTPERF